MKFKVSSIKLTGNPGEGGWAQVHEFASVEVEKLKLRGHLFAVFASRNSREKVEDMVAGRELLTRLHEEYFGSTTQNAFNALKGAVSKVADEFKTDWGDVEIAVVCLVGKVIYAAAAGGATVRIYRQGMLATILESKEGLTVSASGYPREKDILILATSQFGQMVAEGSLKAALKGGELSFAQELLSPIIRSADHAGRTAVSFLKFDSQSVGLGLIEKVSQEKVERKSVLSKPGLFGKVSLNNFVSKIFQKLPNQKIYVKKELPDVETRQKKKTAVSVGGILLVLLLVSIGFGLRQKSLKEKRERYQTKLESARYEFNEALEISSLNPNRARELFVSSRQKVRNLSQEEIDDPQIADLKNQIEKGVEDILGEYTTDADLFIDLTLLAEGFRADKLATADETLFILDKGSKKIVSVAMSTKRSEVIAGPGQINDAQNLAAYSDRVFIAEKEGVYEVGEERKKLLDRQWGEAYEIYAYAGNIYVLDKEKSDILRFTGEGEDFSLGKSWLTEGQTLDLSDSEAWTIDSSVWILTKAGRILRLSLGNLVGFTIEGLYPELTKATSIYTNESLAYLYVLDSEGGRVVVLTKEGNYQAQYLSEKIKETIGFSVSEESKKIILLTTEKLYSLELKHL